MCTNVGQFFVPLDSPHIYHELAWQMTILLNCPRNSLHPSLYSISHLQACPLNMKQTLELRSVVLPYAKKNS